MGQKRECSVAGCKRHAQHRGWCKAHYCRWSKTGDVQAHKPVRDVRYDHGETCTAEGCHGKYHARGLCRNCYAREWQREARKSEEFRLRHMDHCKRSYAKRREVVCATRREKYANDPEFRQIQLDRANRNRLKKKRERFAEILGAK